MVTAFRREPGEHRSGRPLTAIQGSLSPRRPSLVGDRGARPAALVPTSNAPNVCKRGSVRDRCAAGLGGKQVFCVNAEFLFCSSLTRSPPHPLPTNAHLPRCEGSSVINIVLFFFINLPPPRPAPPFPVSLGRVPLSFQTWSLVPEGVGDLLGCAQESRVRGPGAKVLKSCVPKIPCL